MDDLLVHRAQPRRLVDHVRLSVDHFDVADEQGHGIADQERDEVDGDGLLDERLRGEDNDAENVGEETEDVDGRHEETPDERWTWHR